MAKETKTNSKAMTKAEIKKFIEEVSTKLNENEGNSLHALVALNAILSEPGIEKSFDADLKEKAKEIWLTLKTKGIDLIDPPFLFGIPEIKAKIVQKIDGSDEIATPLN